MSRKSPSYMDTCRHLLVVKTGCKFIRSRMSRKQMRSNPFETWVRSLLLSLQFHWLAYASNCLEQANDKVSVQVAASFGLARSSSDSRKVLQPFH